MPVDNDHDALLAQLRQQLIALQQGEMWLHRRIDADEKRIAELEERISDLEARIERMKRAHYTLQPRFSFN